MNSESKLPSDKTKPAKFYIPNIHSGVPPFSLFYIYISESCKLAGHHFRIKPNYHSNNKKGDYLKIEYVKKSIRKVEPLKLRSLFSAEILTI